MGKPYAIELSRLGETYAWALEAPIDSLVAALAASSDLPLLAIGSGGSLSAAHLACSLHQHYTGMLAKAATPLETVTSPVRFRSLSALILSANGSNTDIISAAEAVITREPRRCIVLCLRKGSALSRVARSYRFVDVPDLMPPYVKDGFLSTNALLAFAVVLVRAYARAFSTEILPRNLDALLEETGVHRDYLEDLFAQCRPFWKRETVVVLYGPSVIAAALDLESKFSEAALGNIQLADFRNFAHGRHHWLAKRPSKTAVLAICSNEDRDLCEKTLRLVPDGIPTARLSLSGSTPLSGIAALVAVLHLVGAAGRSHGIDPGRPGVPGFGRRIYRLRALRALNEAPSASRIAIARKLGCDVRELSSCHDLAFWESAYQRFVDRLATATFGAVIVDYDGTLCDDQDRFTGIREDVAQQLARLLRAGIALGVATGRGDSARNDLRRVLRKELWGKVVLGYYNGADLGCLSDDHHPTSPPTPCDPFKDIREALSADPIVSRLAQCKFSHAQISVRPLSPASGKLLWGLVQQMAQNQGFAILRSAHSIDVLTAGVSKRSLIHRIRSLLRQDCSVLCIGDKGQWPGNDFELLRTPYSLSVDEVSPDPESCWNIAPPGHRGVQALLDYLSWAQIQDEEFQLVLPDSGSPVR